MAQHTYKVSEGAPATGMSGEVPRVSNLYEISPGTKLTPYFIESYLFTELKYLFYLFKHGLCHSFAIHLPLHSLLLPLSSSYQLFIYNSFFLILLSEFQSILFSLAH